MKPSTVLVPSGPCCLPPQVSNGRECGRCSATEQAAWCWVARHWKPWRSHRLVCYGSPEGIPMVDKKRDIFPLRARGRHIPVYVHSHTGRFAGFPFTRFSDTQIFRIFYLKQYLSIYSSKYLFFHPTISMLIHISSLHYSANRSILCSKSLLDSTSDSAESNLVL